MIETGSGIFILSMDEFPQKSEMKIHIQPFENVFIPMNSLITVKIVDTPYVMLALSVPKKHIKTIWDSVHESVMKMLEKMDLSKWYHGISSTISNSAELGVLIHRKKQKLLLLSKIIWIQNSER